MYKNNRCDTKRNWRTRFTAMAAAMVLSGCAAQPDANVGADGDPFEPVNRGIFAFNEVVDGILLKPAAEAYVFVVPQYGQERVSNVLSNMRMPVTFFNSVLQGDPENAFSSLWSFLLNSTLGIAGIFDFAGTNTNLKVHHEDLGQTLGVYGVGSGPYLVLPILGPSNVRDTAGLVGDYFSDPFSYYDGEIVKVRAIATAIDKRAGVLDLVEDVYDTSLDPYSTFRSSYQQHRAAEIKK